MQPLPTQLILLALSYLKGIWRHRTQMLVVSWLICLGGWAWVASLPDQYVSAGKILIQDPQSEVDPFLKSLTDLRYSVNWETKKIVEGIATRENITRVVEMLGLTRNLPDGDIHSPEGQELVSLLTAQVTVRPVASKGKSIYMIQHRSDDPQLSQGVVEQLMTILSQEGGPEGRTLEMTKNVEQFLEEQIRNYEEKVARTESELREFSRKNSDLMPGKDGGYYARVKIMTRDLEEEKNKLLALSNKQQELLRKRDEFLGRAVPSTDTTTSANAAGNLDQRIASMNKELEAMQQRYYERDGQKIPLYRDDHPNIVALKKTIQGLEARRDREASPGMGAVDPSDERLANPVYQQLLLSLNEVEMETASTSGRIQELEKQLEELKKLESVLPGVETELIRLQRDVSMNRDKLVALISQQGRARFSGDIVESITKKIRFEIMEHATLPTSPVGPNRRLFNAVVLVAGLVFGLVAALVMALSRPVFYSRSALQDILGIPVLGLVSMVTSTEARWYQSPLVFFLGMLLLLAWFGLSFLGVL